MRLNGLSLFLPIMLGAGLFAAAVRTECGEPNRKAMFISRNGSGSIKQLSVSDPSTEDIATIKSENLAIEDLALDDVDLKSDAIFLDILHSPKLQYLELSNCVLTDANCFIPTVHTNLRSVTLRKCRLSTNVLKDLSLLKRVSAISLQHAEYKTGALDYAALTGTNASRLTIADEAFQDCSWLPHCKNLEFLCVSHTAINDKSIEGISGCQFLNTIELVGTKITDAGLAKLRCAGLRSVMIGSDSLSSQGVGRCLERNSIDTLIIDRMNLKNFELWAIGANANLQSLHLSRTTDTASALATLPLTTRLHSIWLRHCKLNDSAVARMALFSDLEEIDVSNSNITLEQLITIARNPKIKWITCFECELPADTKEKVQEAIGRKITIQR